MELPKKKLREIALQLLYSYDISRSELSELLPIIMHLIPISRKNAILSVEFAKEISQQSEKLDALLKPYATEYSLERISKIDMNVLRLVIYEMENQELPVEVAIAEGVRLSKKFSMPESARFVHAMIDQYAKGKVDATQASL